MKNKKKVLVTGAAGFIGSNLIEKLLPHYNVFGIDNYSSGCNEVDCEVYPVDILDDRVEGIFHVEEPEIVIHLAAKARIQPSIMDPLFYNETNVYGTARLLELSRKYGVKKFINISSSSVYGDNETPFKESMRAKPLNPYAASKYMAEVWAKMYYKTYGLETISLRLFNVYGKNMTGGQYQLVMTAFKEQLEKHRPFNITGDGEQKRDFTHVDDICAGIIAVMEKEGDLGGKVFNLGAGDSRSVNEIARLMAGGPYPHKRIEREGEMRETLASINKAKYVLGWEPKIKLEKGIKDV